jgi:hypothetical protein
MAADPAVLLYALALMDNALEDVEQPADLQAFSSAEMNAISNRVDLQIKPDLMELAVFRRIEKAGVAAPWVTSERPLTVELADKVFGKVSTTKSLASTRLDWLSVGRLLTCSCP